LLATREIHKLPQNNRDWEGRAILIVSLFHDEPDKALAVNFRIQAMNNLVSSGSLPGWATPEQADGSILISEPVWKAAACEPVIIGKHDASFDKEAFVDRVLSFAEPEGHA